MGTQNGHNVPFLGSVFLKKRKRKAMIRIKQIDKILKKGDSKIDLWHLVPKVVIDLPFEGRKVEGSQKYRRRERVPKVEVEEKKPSLNRPFLALESSTQ